MEWYKLDGSGNGGMTHDGAGRVTAEFGRTYTYDDFHSLVRAGAASGSNAQGFQYDAVGRLIAVRRGTAGWPVEEELAYDGMQMVAAWNGAGVATWSAVWGQGVDNLISVKPGVDGAEVMALKDGRGSVVGYYQADATPQGLLATADYTPEGRVTSKDWVTGTTCTETGSTQCPRLGGLPFGFHGAYKSPAHGLLYFRNRWYSAEAGQWLTQDPLGEVDSVNLYAFNRFDSVNFIDPFGLAASSGGGAGVAKGGCKQAGQNETVVCGKRPTKEDKDAEKAAAEDAAAKKEALKQEQRAQQLSSPPQLGGVVVEPPPPPPGPQPPGPGRLGKFPPNQPKPPGGFSRGAQVAEEAEIIIERAELAAEALTIRRILVAITVASGVAMVREPVGNIIDHQLELEPAGTPTPQAASPEKPRPDHPASEPGVPDDQIELGKKPSGKKVPKDAYDPNGSKAPGKPGALEGFEDPAGGEEWVPNPNDRSDNPDHGWRDNTGKVWVPTGPGGGAHGGPHWDVQDPATRKHNNVYPGGHQR